jgi:TRAP-type C4-dicarboxylate transport system permease small subunit
MSWHERESMKTVIKIIEWIVMALVAAVTCLVFTEVVLRDTVGQSLIITEEASRYAMIWVAMLGSALLVAEDGHIRIDVVPAGTPPRIKLLLTLISQVCVLAFLAVMTVTTLTILPEVSRDQTVTLGVSMAVIYAALPVSGVLMIVFTVLNMMSAFRRSQLPPGTQAIVGAAP